MYGGYYLKDTNKKLRCCLYCGKQSINIPTMLILVGYNIFGMLLQLTASNNLPEVAQTRCAIPKHTPKYISKAKITLYINFIHSCTFFCTITSAKPFFKY